MNSILIEKTASRDGLVNAKVSNGERTVSLHSIYPVKEAQKTVAHLNRELGWVVIAGFGLGYIIEYLLDNTDFKIIVFEHTKEIIDFALQSRNLNNVINNPRITLVYSISELTSVLDEKRVGELCFYIHRPYQSLFPEIYSSLEGVLITYLSKKQINKATLLRFQRVWLRNIIKNSRYYFDTPGINNLRHNFKSKPAIIVGAGPSLAKNIGKLKEIEKKAVIISTDTALPSLQAYDITPDFVVSVDPQDTNALYLLYAGICNTTLVLDSSASFLSFFKPRFAETVIFDSMFPLYSGMSVFWGERGALLSGGSVSTTAFDFARFLCADPIAFIGQDLAFSKKHTHNRDNILEEILYYRINRFNTYEAYNSRSLIFSDSITVDGYYGDKVPTDRKFITFLNWFVREIKNTKASVINATEGGAKIEGAIHISLDEFDKTYLSDTLDKIFTVEFEPVKRGNFDKYLDGITQACYRLLPYAIKAFKSSKSAISEFKRGGNLSRYFDDMTRFDRELLTMIKANSEKNNIEGAKVSHFLEFTMQSAIDKILEFSDENGISGELLENWNLLYKEASEGLGRVMHILKKAN
jgi:hypothetical protein